MDVNKAAIDSVVTSASTVAGVFFFFFKGARLRLVCYSIQPEIVKMPRQYYPPQGALLVAGKKKRSLEFHYEILGGGPS